jgi:hypothetical protein
MAPCTAILIKTHVLHNIVLFALARKLIVDTNTS